MHWLIDRLVDSVNVTHVEIDDDGGADVGATPISTADMNPTTISSNDNKKVLQELDANKIIIDNEIQRIQKCGAFSILSSNLIICLELQIQSSNNPQLKSPLIIDVNHEPCM